MKKNGYKIVVLSDLKDLLENTLKSTIGMAKIINGQIEVFSVKKPVDIVGKENQLSAMRTINSEHNSTDKKMRKIIDPLSKDYGAPIKYSFAFGNVKNEIYEFIKERQPDIIVLGKRRSKPFPLMGDSITKYILDTFGGTVMIVADKNVLEPDKGISLGVLNNSELPLSLTFANELMERSKEPLKSFKFVKSLTTAQDTTLTSDKKSVEYVFEHNDNTIGNLSNYLTQNKINVLLVDRAQKGSDNQMGITSSEIRQMVSKLDTHLIVSG